MIIFENCITPKIWDLWKLFLVTEKDNCLNFPNHPSKCMYYLSKGCKSRRKNREFLERADFWVLRFLSTADFEYCGSWVRPLGHTTRCILCIYRLLTCRYSISCILSNISFVLTIKKSKGSRKKVLFLVDSPLRP